MNESEMLSRFEEAHAAWEEAFREHEVLSARLRVAENKMSLALELARLAMAEIHASRGAAP